MSVFNSLGSNYESVVSLRALFGVGQSNARERLEASLEKRYDGQATTLYKGREAIRLGLSQLNLPKNASVGITGYTCFAVYEAVICAGLRPHYLDIDPETLNFTASTLRQAVKNDSNLKVVIVQNTLGFTCDIKAIKKLCRENKLALMEDLAHSIGAIYPDGHEAGTVGDMVALSFGRDKLIDAVSGGALIWRSNDLGIAKPKFRRPPLKSLSRDRLYPLLTSIVRSTYGIGLGKVAHALFKSTGLLSKSVDGDFYDELSLPDWCANLASQGYAELPTNLKHRREIAQVYASTIEPSLQFTKLAKGLRKSSNLRFPLRTKNRASLIKFLTSRDIHISDTWYDAPISPPRYMSQTNYKNECPQAEAVSAVMVNLPTHRGVSINQARIISNEVNRWLRLQ